MQWTRRHAGDALAGSHDRWARTFGYVTGVDYRITPYTLVGFALGGGGTNYGLSDGLGGGHSDMFQAAIYSSTHVDAAYVSAAIAYGFHQFNTDRYVTLAGTDHLAADFAANDIGGGSKADIASPFRVWVGRVSPGSLPTQPCRCRASELRKPVQRGQ